MKKTLILFRTYHDPLEAEELVDLLQSHQIVYERVFEKSEEEEDYIGSHPFDTKIVIKIHDDDFLRAEALLKPKTD